MVSFSGPAKDPRLYIARKTSATTVNNSTTLVNAASISLPVAASEIWEFRVILHYSSGATPDLKIGWTVPSGTTMVWSYGPDGVSALAGLSESATDVIGGGAADPLIANLFGLIIVSTTAGTVQMQFAQNTQDASDTIIKANTVLVATKIS